MKVYKNNSKQLDELLREAGADKPIMDLSEVENIVSTGRYVPAAAKGFHIGINTVIVMSGIIVSSFLAFMAMKVDKQSSMAVPAVVSTMPEVKSSPASVAVYPSTADQKQSVSTSLKASDKIHPQANADRLLASVNKNVVAENKNVVSDKAITETSNNNVASASDLKESSSKTKKILTSEFSIGFTSNDDQKVIMKLVGNELSELTIDGATIAPGNYEDYNEVIAEGRNYLAGGGGKEEEKNSLNLIKYFDEQLQSDQLIPSGVSYTFELTSTELLINKASQSTDAFNKYKKLYEIKTGKEVTAGSVYRFERGARN